MSTKEPIDGVVGSASANFSPERLSSERVTTLSRRSGASAASSLACCLFVVIIFWHEGHHRYLVGLLSTLLTLHGIAVARHLADVRSARRAHSVTVACVITALVALVWATVPIELAPHASPQHRQLLVYIATGLISSSILLSPVLPASLLFAGINAIGLIAVTPIIEPGIAVEHSLLITIYVILICIAAYHQSRDFDRRIRNELTVTEQSDIIGMLLSDFEANASDWLWETDQDLRLQRVSTRLASLLGLQPSLLQGASLRGWISQGLREAGADKGDATALLKTFADRTAFQHQHVYIIAGREPRWFALTGRPIIDAAGCFAGYRGVGSDLTAIRRSDAQITYLAHYDSLTGLPNRTKFRETLADICARRQDVTLFVLDLDGFKAVNDTLGHQVGDAVLVEVAGRLRACLPEGDMAARLGGDEFAILHMSDNEDRATCLAQCLIESLSVEFKFGSVTADIGLSVGLALPRDAGVEPEDLMRAADLALHRSKVAGHGQWNLFTPSMAARAQERQALQADLRSAIEHNELTLDFQPIIDFANGNIVAAEALVRWLHPTRGRISPADFIPVAEESGLILPLGALVLRRACQVAATWPGNPRIAVNLSPVQFRDPGLLSLVDRVLAETGLPAHRLELESTESGFLDALDSTVSCLNALRSRGVHIALDDFGTGYSSLSYLRSFPFDKVKIDQSFIRDLGANDDAIAIVQAIVGMAGSLGMRTTGEGVETSLQADILRSTGCSQVQGYLFGRPCSAAMITDMMSPKTARESSSTLEVAAV